MMKKIMLSLIMVLIMALSVSAFSVSNQDSTIDVVGKGSVSGQVSIVNDEASSITVTGANNINFGDFNSTVSYNPATITVENGTTKTVTYSFTVPEDLAGTYTANLAFTEGGESHSIPVQIDVTQLSFDDFDINIGGDTDKNIQDEDEGYRFDPDGKPGDRIEFKFKFENLYSKDSNIEIAVDEIQITIEDIDDGDDLDDSIDSFDIREDDSESVSLEMEIPKKAEEDKFKVLIEVDAEDDDGNDMSFSIEYELNVERESHQIDVDRAEFSRSTIDCDESTSLYVEVINMGSKYEDDPKITVKNADLGIDLVESDFELDDDPGDDDNEFSKTFDIELPENVKAGTYTFETVTYWDNKASDVARTELTVRECVTSTPKPNDTQDEEEEDTTTVTVQPTQPTQPTQNTNTQTAGQTTTGTTQTATEPVTVNTGSSDFKESFTESVWFIVLLVVVNVFIVGGLIYLIAKFLFK